MAKQVASMTFGILREDLDEATLAEFNGIDEQIIAASIVSPGFVNNAEASVQWELGRPRWEQNYGEWGQFVCPRFYTYPKSNDSPPPTQILSTWEDLQSLKKFTYEQVHGEALRRRSEWFQKGDWPNHVIWYIEPGVIPTWEEGCRRLESLAVKGPSVEGFSFPRVFSPEGEALATAW